MKTLQTSTNIFDLPSSNTQAVCITTNCMIKRNGAAVMGAGIAKEANNRYQLDFELAKHLKSAGNVPCIFTKTGQNNCRLISFPTKHDWKDKSSIDLIKRSAQLLVELCNYNHITQCFLTPPGCGCGGLDWSFDVAPVLKDILDDRFVIVFRQ